MLICCSRWVVIDTRAVFSNVFLNCSTAVSTGVTDTERAFSSWW